MTKKLLLALVLVGGTATAKVDKVLDMIRRIDTNGINEIYIPGFFVSEKEKTRYQKAAKEVKDRTYRSLHSVAPYDLVRFVKGTVKGAAGLAVAFLGYKYYFGNYGISNGNRTKEGTLIPSNTDISNGSVHPLCNKWSTLGLFGALSLYLLKDARDEFSDIYNRKERQLAHHNARAQNDYINDLPVCDVGACDTVLDEPEE